MGAAAGFRRARPAPRRARRDLRDRGARRHGATDVFLLGERGKYPPPGANGGGPALLNRFIYETDSGEATPPLVSEGDRHQDQSAVRRVRLETPGGSELRRSSDARSRTRIARDVRLGYVTARSRGARLSCDRRGRRQREGARMSLIVGIDVGGTFTDLFRFDAATRTFTTREGAVAPRRWKPPVFSTGCARSAVCRRDRSCTARRSAPTRCSSGAARASA